MKDEKKLNQDGNQATFSKFKDAQPKLSEFRESRKNWWNSTLDISRNLSNAPIQKARRGYPG